MQLNLECVRALLIFISENLTTKANGRLRPVKMRHHLNNPQLAGFSQEEIFAAARYLVEKKFVNINTLDQAKQGVIAPRAYVFTEITANGFDYLRVIENTTAWKKLTQKLGNIFEHSLPTILTAAAELGLALVLG